MVAARHHRQPVSALQQPASWKSWFARKFLGEVYARTIDGGVKPGNIGEIAAAGADTFVAGSAIFGHPDYAAVIADMRAAVAAAR